MFGTGFSPTIVSVKFTQPPQLSVHTKYAKTAMSDNIQFLVTKLTLFTVVQIELPPNIEKCPSTYSNLF